MHDRRINDRRIISNALKIIGLVLLTVAAVWLVVELRTLIVCLIFSLTLASAITPVAEWGERHRIPRAAMVTMVYLGVGLVYAVVAVSLAPTVKVQATHLYEHLPQYLSRMTDWFESIKGGIGIAGEKAQELQIQELLKNVALKLGNQTLDIGAGLLGMILHALLVLFLTAYFVVEATTIWQKLLIWLPPQHRLRAGALIRPIGARMGGYVRGQLLVSVAVACFLGLGLYAIRIDYALILGVLAGLMNLVPFVGSAFACTFAVVVAANQELWQVGATIGLFLLEQWVESNFIVPYLLGKNVDLHPLIVLFAILIGANLMGVPGALIAVPVASALQLLAQEFYLKPLNVISTGVTISGATTAEGKLVLTPYAVGDFCKLNPYGGRETVETPQHQTAEIIVGRPTKFTRENETAV